MNDEQLVPLIVSLIRQCQPMLMANMILGTDPRAVENAGIEAILGKEPDTLIREYIHRIMEKLDEK